MVKKFLPLGTVMIGFMWALLPGPFLNDAAGQAQFAGVETCKSCHPSQFETYARSSHGVKGDPRTPAAKNACEACHGPGAAHVKAGGGRGVGIRDLSVKSPLGAEARNAVCLQCHDSGGRAMWNGSMHESRGVSCTNCHSAHAGNPKNLAKPTQPAVCSQCHKNIQAQLQRFSHHPIREGKVVCSDCHNPHGTVTEKLLSANSVNEKCYQCHAEKRGPFLWEHAPVTESCLTCHTPHGSSHDKLLVAKRPWLCQSCHSNSRHPGTIYALRPEQAGQSVYTASSNRLFFRACNNCHSQIHGSNHPSGKALAR